MGLLLVSVPATPPRVLWLPATPPRVLGLNDDDAALDDAITITIAKTNEQNNDHKVDARKFE